MASTVDVKSAFNIKVLKRHDSAIDSIVHSASFVVLYLYDTRKGAWSKTGIEGPMFLYHRTQAPHYGMFLLNRNGVDNFSVPLTKDDDLELTDEFVILRTEDATSLGDEDDDDDDDEKIIGVWVFEKDQRHTVGNEMLKLQSLAAKEDAAPSASIRDSSVSSTSQAQPASISLDALFASASQPSRSHPSPPRQHAPTQATSSAGSVPALLDAIFQSASSPSPRPSPQPAAPPEAPPSAPAGSTPSSLSSSSDAAAGLMAMLGLGSSAKPSAPPAPPQKESSSSNDGQDNAATGTGILPAGLQALFSSAAAAIPSTSGSSSNKEAPSSANGAKPAVDPPTGPKRALTPTGPKAGTTRSPAQSKRNIVASSSPVKSAAPLSAPTGPRAASKPREAQAPQQSAAAAAAAPAAPSFRDTSATAVNGQLAKHEEKNKSSGASEPPLSKTEFMRELLGLIHTDKAFTTDLYEAYLSRQRK